MIQIRSFVCIAILLILLQAVASNAQTLAERFHIGLYGGINSSLILPLERNSVLLENSENTDKEYAPLTENLGMQFGFMARFDILPNLCISLEPGYTTYTYGYSNRYMWQGLESITYDIEYRHRLRFIDVPLFAEFKRAGKFQPYAKAGGYMGFMLGAGSQITMQQTNEQLGQLNTTTEDGDVSSANAFIPFQYGLAAGAGIRYPIGSTFIGLDFTYKFPLSKMNNTNTRFANKQLAGGFYDISDNVMLHNFAINLQIIVPFFKKGGGSGGGRGAGRRKGTIPCPSDL